MTPSYISTITRMALYYKVKLFTSLKYIIKIRKSAEVVFSQFLGGNFFIITSISILVPGMKLMVRKVVS